MKLLLALGLIALLGTSEREISSGTFHHSRHRYHLQIKKNRKFEMRAGDCTWGFKAKGNYIIEKDTIHFFATKLNSTRKGLGPVAAHYFKWFSKAIYLSSTTIIKVSRVADIDDNVLYIAKDTLTLKAQ